MQVESREERDSKSQKEGEEEGDPMDRNEFIPNEEWIRQTMIMQDQIFREQVNERNLWYKSHWTMLMFCDF